MLKKEAKLKSRVWISLTLSASSLILSCSESVQKSASEKQLPSVVEEAKSDAKEAIKEPAASLSITKQNIRTYAQGILSDSIQAADDQFAFAILDSMTHEQAAIRDFYFPVFQRIVQNSDGALGEVIGLYSLQYIKKYPLEFLKRYPHCTERLNCTELINISEHVQFEIGMSTDVQKEMDDFKKWFELKLQNADKSIQIRGGLFLNQIEEGIDEYL